MGFRLQAMYNVLWLVLRILVKMQSLLKLLLHCKLVSPQSTGWQKELGAQSLMKVTEIWQMPSLIST